MELQQSPLINSVTCTKNPVRRKIFVEEAFQDFHGKTTLIRRINWEEFYEPYLQNEKLVTEPLENHSQVDYYVDNTSNPIAIAKFQSNLVNDGVKSNFRDNSLQFATNIYEETPMEVDSSNDQFIFDNINMNENNVLNNRELNFRKRKTNQNMNQHKSTSFTTNETFSTLIPINKPSVSTFSRILLVLSILFTVVLIYIIAFGDQLIYINRSFQVDKIKRELQENVLFQEEAVEVIVRSFEKLDSWSEQVKILPFVGSTGVGKTFTVNIIKKHFLPQLVHDINSNHLTNIEKEQGIIVNLYSCCCNLIIIDDLKANDFDNFSNFIKKLPKSHVLLIIPIFNIQDTSDGVVYEIKEDDFKLIRNEFEKLGLYYELVIFNMLKPHMIKKWVQQEISKQRINENKYDSLVKFLIDNNNVKYKGFKGLDAKLLLALDSN